MSPARSFAALLLAAGLAGRTDIAAAGDNTVDVRFNPITKTVNQGQAFSLEIVADIPEPIYGWGLDIYQFSWHPDPLSYEVSTVLPWLLAPAADDDDLAAFAIPFQPPLFDDGVMGDDIVLARLDFTLEPEFVGEILLELDYTSDDPTEGFPLRTPGEFADATFTPALITVLPEPATGMLLLAAAAGVIRRRRSEKRSEKGSPLVIARSDGPAINPCLVRQRYYGSRFFQERADGCPDRMVGRPFHDCGSDSIPAARLGCAAREVPPVLSA